MREAKKQLRMKLSCLEERKERKERKQNRGKERERR